MNIRRIAFLWIIGVLAQMPLASAEPNQTLLGSYAEAGRIAEAKAAVLAALQADPANANLRFEFALAQLFGTVEALGRQWHRYGLHESIFGLMVPFLRVPVPLNKNPERVTNDAARQVLAEFLAGLGETTQTLAEIKDDAAVKVPLRIGLVRLDLDGDGVAGDDETLWKLYTRLNPGVRVNEETARGFLIHLDAADVRWLEGYCHLVSALGEVVLAHDTARLFSHTAHLFFSNVESPFDFLKAGGEGGRAGVSDFLDGIAFIHLLNFPLREPQRMQRALAHLQQVTRLSRESWKLILAETDDDREWIPAPKQTGVLPNGRVTPEMVEGWFRFLDEADALLAGRKLAPFWREAQGRGINVNKVFTAPEPFDVVLWVQGSGAAPFLEKGTLSAPEFWATLNGVFRGQFLGFALWFN